MTDSYGMQIYGPDGTLRLDTTSARLMKILGTATMTKPAYANIATLRINVPEMTNSLGFWLAVTKVTNAFGDPYYYYDLKYELFDGYVIVTIGIMAGSLNIEKIDIDFTYGAY